ncbi:MAG: general secretion pathway protein GspK [Fimbriimonadaceae bacterium]|nr:general secretion pathway protein GspK [Fimbriimonadaceae bacterium]
MMRRKDSGGVFIMTLIVLVGLVAIVASFAATQRVSYMARQNRIDHIRAELMAESGVQRAMAELELIEAGTPTTTQDEWALLGNAGSDRFVVAEGSIRIQIVDASARVDLNTAAQEQLQRLPLTNEQVESLLDWRSPETAPRPEGAKDEYYNNLEYAYNAALRPFITVDELLLVRGFTPATLYQPTEVNNSNQFLAQGDVTQQPLLIDLVMTGQLSSPVAAAGQQLINANQAQGVQIGQAIGNIPLGLQIAQNRPYTSMQDLLVRNNVTTQTVGPILDNLTVSTEQEFGGKINLNTASEAVLNSIPAFTPDISQAIIQRQDAGMTTLGEIAAIPGMTVDILRQSVDLFTINSRTFLIRVIGTYGSSQSIKEVFVHLTDTGPRILRTDQPRGDNLLTRWGWQPEAANDIVLAEAQ